MLEWLFNDKKSRLRNKHFGVQYYSIGSAGRNIIDISDNNEHNLAKASIQPVQLIVFICKTSEILYKDLNLLCKDQIVPIVVEKNLPFIVCLNHFGLVITQKIEISAQMRNVTNILQESLKGTYQIVRTEVPSGRYYSIKIDEQFED